MRLEADVPNWFDADVDLQFMFDCEAKDTQVIVTVVDINHNVDSAWYSEFLSLGIADYIDGRIWEYLSSILAKKVGKQISVPAGRTIVAVQPQESGALRAYFER